MLLLFFWLFSCTEQEYYINISVLQRESFYYHLLFCFEVVNLTKYSRLRIATCKSKDYKEGWTVKPLTAFQIRVMTLDLICKAMFSIALREAMKMVLLWVIKRGTLERSLMRRKLQLSKGKLISFPDKMECVLNFERRSGLHLCGSW